ncbi:hypothetical protein GOP47_0028878 [Adiantum capillus-veneris]|nr:hypothetical protein GOP47_0028878 [Adiantum capillus-veneris]
MASYTDRGDALRARGNVLYGEVAGGGGGDAAEKRAKLKRAQELYKEALELSCDSERRASCCKNLGALHYLWGRVELDMMPSWTSGEGEGEAGRGGRRPSSAAVGRLSAVTQQVGQAVRFYVRAHVEGARAEKPSEWMGKVGDALSGVVTWAAEQSRILAFPGAPILRSVCEDLESVGRSDLAFKVEAEALANLELAACLYKHCPDSSCGVFINGVPAAVEQPLSNARRLLDSLPPSPASLSLLQRLSELGPADEGLNTWPFSSFHKVQDFNRR